MDDPFDALETEADRVYRFYAGLSGSQWSAPTRCAGWDRKDLLAHLLAGEEYTRACLDDRVDEYMRQARDVGYERFNEVLVERRRAEDGARLLAEWRAAAAGNHRELRERGPDAQLATSVGPYPLGRQAWYLACELAIHADDAGVPVSGEERAARLGWRARFALDALAEAHPDVEVHPDGDVKSGGGYRVRAGGDTATLTEEEFVEATSGRPAGGAPILGALRALA